MYLQATLFFFMHAAKRVHYLAYIVETACVIIDGSVCSSAWLELGMFLSTKYLFLLISKFEIINPNTSLETLVIISYSNTRFYLQCSSYSEIVSLKFRILMSDR